MLIAAAGNAGPKSPPLYPGADENVIAITATDAQDHLFPMANVGPYVAAAAPGVDVLLPAPNGAYSLETGTSEPEHPLDHGLVDSPPPSPPQKKKPNP